MRVIAKTDANQPAIVAALRAVGATVQILATVGDGCPDLLVGYRGRNYLLEVKTVGGGMTPDQVRWHAAWRGDAPEVARCVDDALAMIGAVRVGGEIRKPPTRRTGYEGREV